MKNKENKTVIRLRTEMYCRGNSAFIKKSLTTLKKKSTGYNLLIDDIGHCDANEVLSRIVNLDECKDGLYILTTTNVSTDYWSGYVDDYDYILLPYREFK